MEKSGINSTSDERKELLSCTPSSAERHLNRDEEHFKVYKKRWYILAMFFGVCTCQGIIYNTWAPIQSTARAVYGWESYVVDLLPALGCIAPCITIVPLGWLMDVKGLRISVLLAAGFQFFGATLRCVPTAGNWTIRTVLICVGQSLSGLIAPVPLSGGVLLSATWFPSNQRTTSTAIAVAGSFIGNALSFIAGPLMVDDVASSDIPKQGDNFVLNSTQRDAYSGQINRLLYTEAGLTAVLFLGIIVYYPARPPIPPSRSSGAGREDTLKGWKKLIKDPNFLLLALLYGAGTGVYNGWCAVLDQNLSEFGLGQTFAGWLGFIAIVSGAFSGIFFSISAGHFTGYLKEFLIVFMACATFSILIICLIFTKVIPFRKAVICIVFGLTGFSLNGAVPFFFELGAEMAYPVAEGITTSAIKFNDYFLQGIFLIISMGHFGAKWMTYVTMVTCAATTILLLLVREKYNRLTVDIRPNDLPD